MSSSSANSSKGGHGHSHGGHGGGHGHSHGPSSYQTAHVHDDHDHDESQHDSFHNEHKRANSKSNFLSVSTARSNHNSDGGTSPPSSACVGHGDGQTPKVNTALGRARRKLILVSILCCIFMVAEVIGGFLANSLAIMTDAAHLLSDLAGFLISIFALWLAQKAPTSKLSFGFHRAEIIGALLSVLLIWVLTGVLVYEAIQRILKPEEVDGKLMFVVATLGLTVNLVMGCVLFSSGHGHSHGLSGGHGHSHGGHGGHDEENPETESLVSSTAAAEHEENINVRAALIHVIGDAIQSVGVMLAAALIWYNPTWNIADPICTFLFSILVLFTTTRLVGQSMRVLMEGSPEGIDPAAVERALARIPGVVEVHDLHIWSLTVGKASLSVHLLSTGEASKVLENAHQLLAKQFSIHHTTIQVEHPTDAVYCNPNFQ